MNHIKSRYLDCLGIPQELYWQDILPVPEENANKPSETISDATIRRCLKPYIGYIKGRYGNKNIVDIFKKEWIHFPRQLFSLFTLDDICKLAHDSHIEFEFYDEYREEVPTNLISRISQSLWHHHTTEDWNYLVKLYNGFRRFKFRPDKFLTTISFPNPYTQFGWCYYGYCGGERDRNDENQMVYCDGSLAFFVHCEQRHVMTIGLSVSKEGILISQVQNRNPKGNKWMHSIGHPIDETLEEIERAFPNIPVYLVDGESLANATKDQYKTYTDGTTLSEKNYEHIISVYNRELKNHTRGESLTCGPRQLTYRKVLKVNEEVCV